MQHRQHRIVIGDDHALMLEGTKSLLEKDYEIAATARDGRQLLDEALAARPDLVVLDVSMPELNGFAVAQQIKCSLPSTKLVFLSMHSNPMYLRKALELGADAYVLKSGELSELTAAIRAVLSGQKYVSEGFDYGVRESLLTNTGKPARADELTARQVEILQLIAEGKLSKEIAHLLNISVKTVDFHRARIMSRLGAHTVAEMVRLAVEQNLIPAAAADYLPSIAARPQ